MSLLAHAIELADGITLATAAEAPIVDKNRRLETSCFIEIPPNAGYKFG
jgi:hypothetical protein